MPRHLRRRAASHDVRRVPLRLRDRARAEVSLKPSGPSVACLTIISETVDGSSATKSSWTFDA